MVKILIPFLFPCIALAQVPAEMMNKLMEALGKKSGFEQELTRSGENIYKSLPGYYQGGVLLLIGIVDFSSKEEINIVIKFDF